MCAHPHVQPEDSSLHTLRDPCPGHGCRNHHPGQTLGQVAGGLVTVTALTTRRQERSLPAKSAVCKAFPGARRQGRLEAPWGPPGPTRPAPRGAARTGEELSCQREHDLYLIPAAEARPRPQPAAAAGQAGSRAALGALPWEGPLPETDRVALGSGHQLPQSTPFLGPRGRPAGFAELLGALLDPECLAGADLRHMLTAHPPLNQHSPCQAPGGACVGGAEGTLLSWGTCLGD